MFRGVYIAAAVGCGLLARPAAASTVTFTGYVTDNLCFDKCQVAFNGQPGSGCDKCALDKTNVITNPEDHTVHCIRDVKACIDSGYSLLQNAGTAAAPDFQIRLKLDDAGNSEVFKLIETTQLHAGLSVVATGTDNGDGVLRGATFTQCNPNTTDCSTGTCVGCISTATTDDLQTPINPTMVLIHGAFMLLAWALFAPMAWLIKRHAGTVPFLRLTRKVKPFGKPFPLAFLLHGGLNTSAVVCTIIGGAIAAAEFDRRALFGHGALGLVVIITAIWQPFPAFFCRPVHGHPKRLLFNRVHRTGGVICLVGGGINVILGTFNYSTLWDPCIAPIFSGLAFSLIGVFIALAIGLEVKSLIGGGGDGGHGHGSVQTKSTKSAQL